MGLGGRWRWGVTGGTHASAAEGGREGAVGRVGVGRRRRAGGEVGRAKGMRGWAGERGENGERFCFPFLINQRNIFELYTQNINDPAWMLQEKYKPIFDFSFILIKITLKCLAIQHILEIYFLRFR